MGVLKHYRPFLFPIALVIYEVIVYLSNDMNLPSLPTLEKDFQVSRDLTQYTLLTWFLGSASLQLFIGPLSDRFGRRIVLLTSGWLFIISTLCCAMAQDIMTMLIARFVQGSTVCSVLVAGYAAIHELYDSKTAIKVITVMGSTIFLAPAFGPILGALIIEMSNWRMIFWLLAILGFVITLILYRVMPETTNERHGIYFKRIFKDYIAILTNRRFLKFAIPFWFIDMAMIIWIVQSPFLIIETYQKSVLWFGIIQLLVFGGFIIGTQVTNYLLHKIEPINIIFYGLLTAFIGGILLYGFAYANPTLTYVITSLIIISLGSAMCLGPLNRLSIEACEEPMGCRTAIFASIMGLFGVGGTFLVSLFQEMNAQNLALTLGTTIILGFVFFKLLR